MIREQVLQRVVSRSVKDIYGRPVGSVVGYVVDASGGLKSLGVDHSGGAFNEYAAEQIIFDNDVLVMVPRWRNDVEKLGRLRTTVGKRSQSLEELKSEGEIPQHVYDVMKTQLDEDTTRLQAASNALREGLEKRSNELSRRRGMLEQFIATVMVQHRSGEIDDAAYEASKSNVVEMLAQDDREQVDLRSALKMLAPLETPVQGEVFAPEMGQSTPLS